MEPKAKFAIPERASPHTALIVMRTVHTRARRKKVRLETPNEYREIKHFVNVLKDKRYHIQPPSLGELLVLLTETHIIKLARNLGAIGPKAIIVAAADKGGDRLTVIQTHPQAALRHSLQ